MSAESEMVIEDFIEKKDRLNEKANKHRDLRDKLNGKTKEWANRRDELNAKVRELVDKANKHKERRDELNKKVQEAKAKRDELNRVANEKADKLNELKKDRLPRDGPSLGKLKRKIRDLEFKQMTKVLSPDKEKEIIELISKLQQEIKEKENAFEKDQDIKGAYQELQEAKQAAEDQHQTVTGLADEAQTEHDSMVSLFEEADKFRKEADAAQEKFVESKVKADEVHYEYIDMVNQIRDYEKVIGGMRAKKRRMRKERGEAQTKAAAEEIYEKFKDGEKISTEELMTLQKAGLL